MNIFEEKLSRREFLKKAFLIPLGLGATHLFARDGKGFINKKEAYYYKKLAKKRVKCLNCPHECVLAPGERGFCKVRENRNGILYTLVYGNVCAAHIDPVEKKPLFHFLPTSEALSVATAGCNFRCQYCQNWDISQRSPEETVNYNFPPKEAVNVARKEGITSIAYTYNEPSVFYEYMFDTAKLARKNGIRSIAVTNAFLNPAPLRQLCKWLDAASVTLKWSTDELYQKISAGRLKPVLKSLKIMRKENVHLEIINLVVPTLNDDKKSIRDIVIWIKENLGREVPLHFSRFFPMYKLKGLPPTPIETLMMARKIAMDEGLYYVYIGNYPGGEWENTYCPKCKKLLIRRRGHEILENNVKDGKCKFCGFKIYGVWK
jgi:pyruvate formate lyase activating enzyme